MVAEEAVVEDDASSDAKTPSMDQEEEEEEEEEEQPLRTETGELLVVDGTTGHHKDLEDEGVGGTSEHPDDQDNAADTDPVPAPDPGDAIAVEGADSSPLRSPEAPCPGAENSATLPTKHDDSEVTQLPTTESQPDEAGEEQESAPPSKDVAPEVAPKRPAELPPVQVCVRVRPLLDWEKAEGQLSSLLQLKTENSHEKENEKVEETEGKDRTKSTKDGEAAKQRCREISLRPRSDADSASRSRHRTFRFDGVFQDCSSQEDVWEQSKIDSLVGKVSQGFHGTVFAYGQTGSGKTYTMEGFTYNHHNGTSAPSVAAARPKVAGEPSDPTKLGIIPRAVRSLFQRLQASCSQTADESPSTDAKATGDTWSVKVSFLQIYNEKILDLLNPAPMSKGSNEDSAGLRMRWDSAKQQFFVENLFEFECMSEEEVLSHYSTGARNKHMASTNMNVASSRSHTVLVLTVTQTVSGSTGSSRQIVSKLSLVDLAGSERAWASSSATASAGSTSTAGGQTRFQEAVNINQSLFVLRRVITALSKKGKADGDNTNSAGGLGAVPAHIPYRESKLTSLLQHAIGGNSYLVMLACLSPADRHWEENLSTLQYAAQAANIKNTPSLNLDPKDKLIQQLQAQLAAAHSYILRLTGESELPAELLALQGSFERNFAAAGKGLIGARDRSHSKRQKAPPDGRQEGEGSADGSRTLTPRRHHANSTGRRETQGGHLASGHSQTMGPKHSAGSLSARTPRKPAKSAGRGSVSSTSSGDLVAECAAFLARAEASSSYSSNLERGAGRVGGLGDTIPEKKGFGLPVTTKGALPATDLLMAAASYRGEQPDPPPQGPTDVLDPLGSRRHTPRQSQRRPPSMPPLPSGSPVSTPPLANAFKFVPLPAARAPSKPSSPRKDAKAHTAGAALPPLPPVSPRCPDRGTGADRPQSSSSTRSQASSCSGRRRLRPPTSQTTATGHSEVATMASELESDGLQEAGAASEPPSSAPVVATAALAAVASPAAGAKMPTPEGVGGSEGAVAVAEGCTPSTVISFDSAAGMGEDAVNSGLWEAVEELKGSKLQLEKELKSANEQIVELQECQERLRQVMEPTELPSTHLCPIPPHAGAATGTTLDHGAVRTANDDRPDDDQDDWMPGSIEAVAAAVKKAAAAKADASGRNGLHWQRRPLTSPAVATSKEENLGYPDTAKERLQVENATLKKEMAGLQEQLDIFYKAIELKDAEASPSYENAAAGDDPNAFASLTKAWDPNAIGDLVEKLHSQLILEAIGLRKEVAGLKRKKWVLRSVLASGGEIEQRAIDEEIAELQRSKASGFRASSADSTK